MRLRPLLRLVLASAAFLFATAAAQAGEQDVRRLWQVLDYLSVDYAGAVKDGQVLSASEYAEMREFAHASQQRLGALDARPGRDALVAEAGGLAAAIEAKQDPARVATLAHALATHLIAVYPVAASPSAVPDIARAPALYAQNCAACHGATGHGDGPVGLTLNPHPIAFAEPVRASQRSAFSLYQVMTQGIEGTPMASFAALPEADRWALAFYVGQFAHDPADARAGEALWNGDGAIRARLPSLDALARTTQADLGAQIGARPAAQVMAFLHVHPEAIVAGRPAGLALARQGLSRSVQAYARGDAASATDLALAAYLDGVEPVEPALEARDAALKARLETDMGAYRTLVANHAPLADVQARAGAIDRLFDRADAALASSTDATAAFLGSLTILVREGLEALLVVVAMIAFLRKAGRHDMLRWVHAGWIAALVAGGATWVAATWLVAVSGASRELTEGLSSLFAAAVLLSIGIWMHGKSVAGRWQQYLRERLASALDGRSALFLGGFAFIAVYREVFETILFYAALWEQGNHHAVASGLAAGAAVLAAIAFALLRFSARLPIGTFFAWSSALIGLLAVVLTGKGIAALQEAGWMDERLVAGPRIDLLGIYPSAQTLLSQLAVALLVVAAYAWNLHAARRSRPT